MRAEANRKPLHAGAGLGLLDIVLLDVEGRRGPRLCLVWLVESVHAARKCAHAVRESLRHGGAHIRAMSCANCAGCIRSQS
eukprot:354654-Chlamydomonas_euryale.AAC.5